MYSREQLEGSRIRLLALKPAILVMNPDEIAWLDGLVKTIESHLEATTLLENVHRVLGLIEDGE